MNREYAYNRDKGKCKCCKKPLFLDDKKFCYHVKGGASAGDKGLQLLMWMDIHAERADELLEEIGRFCI